MLRLCIRKEALDALPYLLVSANTRRLPLYGLSVLSILALRGLARQRPRRGQHLRHGVSRLLSPRTVSRGPLGGKGPLAAAAVSRWRTTAQIIARKSR